MINTSNILQFISFFAYVLVQVVLLQNVVLFDSAFCFLYIAFLLMLPVDMGILALMFLGFVTGFAVDIFYDSLGLHAAASVAVMYFRNYWLNLITPQGGYDSGTSPTIVQNGWQWFIGYSLPLVFVHHIILFFIEAFGFGLIGFTLMKAIMSTLFTTLVIIIVQFVFYKRKRN